MEIIYHIGLFGLGIGIGIAICKVLEEFCKIIWYAYKEDNHM